MVGGDGPGLDAVAGGRPSRARVLMRSGEEEGRRDLI